MTVRVTTLKHATAGKYYTEHLPSYYLDGDEPPGRWWGSGADLLTLDGDIEPEAFLSVMAGHDPVTGSDLGRRFGERSVRGFDATFSAPESVSVLFGVGEPELRNEITELTTRPSTGSSLIEKRPFVARTIESRIRDCFNHAPMISSDAPRL